MNRSRENIRFDRSRRRVTRNGRPIKLQDKAARVLAMIATRAPAAVSRAELIDAVWSGNHLVGERGLNQALWAIRSELNDDARNPLFIKTLPREGYRWLITPRNSRRMVSTMSIAASTCVIILAVVIGSTTTPADEVPAFVLPEKCAIEDKSEVQAYRVNRDVFVDSQNGCRLIVKPSGTKEFGPPMISNDGRHVAFTVREEKSCRFVSVALQDGRRTEFDNC